MIFYRKLIKAEIRSLQKYASRQWISKYIIMQHIDQRFLLFIIVVYYNFSSNASACLARVSARLARASACLARASACLACASACLA